MFQLTEEDLQGKGDSPLGTVNNLNDQADLVIADIDQRDILALQGFL